MAKIKGSFSVLGLSTFGFRTAVGLFEAGATVIAVDKNEHLVAKISQKVTQSVTADVTDWEAMEQIGAFDVDVVIIGFRKAFDASVLLTNYIHKNTGVSRIIAQVDTDEKGEALRVMGVDKIVFPELDTADDLIRKLSMPNLLEHIPLSPGVGIVEFPTPESFHGKTMAELNIRARYQVFVLGIKHKRKNGDKEKVIIPFPTESRFKPGDIMFLLGSTKDLNRFIQKHSRA